MDENNTQKKVLVVEDEPDALKIYLDILGGVGLDVDGSTDGKDALQKMSEKDYDLVLLDIIMPEMDGLETLQTIKRNTQKYGLGKILMLSNIGGDIAIDKAMKIGADGYMLKSETEPLDLIQIVNKYLED